MDQQVPVVPDDPEEEPPAQVTPVPTQKRKRGQRKEAAESTWMPEKL